MDRHYPYAFLALIFLSVAVAAAPVSVVSWKGTTEIATGPGDKGPWEQNNSRYNYIDDPAVSIDQRGNVTVAWVDQTRKDVLFQRLSPDGSKQLAEPVNVSRSPDTFSWIPRMARTTESPERIYVLWQEIIFSGGSHGGDMLFARSEDNGATFSEPLNLSRSMGGDGKGRINAKVWHNGSYDLVAGPDGTLYTTWTEYDGALWFSRSIDGGKNFSVPQLVAGGKNTAPIRAPSLALGSDRRVYLAWTTGENDDADIHVASSVDGGMRFGAPEIVAPGKGYSDAPKLAASPDGMLHLVYAQSRDGPFDQYQVMYTRSADGRKFDAPRVLSTPLPKGVESAAYSSFSIDAAGRLYVVYELFPDYRERPRGLGFSVSIDNGKSFTAPALVPGSRDPSEGTNGSHQGLMMNKLAVSRDGNIAIVNSSLLQGKKSRVWLIQGKISG
ncbi:sialidase family protein [Herbaspirillum sp. GCM10030257]|uniref:sialidase family protein n=1 Tax=Herbaspirillum sp. GCM10030257 TaxID=3273393 RepID=UPI00361833D7